MIDLEIERLSIETGSQGSALGQFLFLLPINDLTDVYDKAEIAKFADDTTIFYSIKETKCFLLSKMKQNLYVIRFRPTN